MRRIGGVDIFELHGVLAEPWSERVRGTVEREWGKEKGNAILMNLKDVEKIDRSGAESVLGALRRGVKAAIWGQNLTTYYVAEHMNPNEGIPIFERGLEAVSYFGREFAEGITSMGVQRRRFPRVSTALPIEIECEKAEQPFYFEGVVTNLSDGGLYCQFLDSESEELAKRIDPFDFQLVRVRLHLGEQDRVEGEGKILRSRMDTRGQQGMAVEFYDLKKGEKERMTAFLKRKNTGREAGEGRND